MLSKFSVRKPYTVVVGVVLIILLGIVSFQNMTVDLLPDMDMPYAAVFTAYPGASPEQVEEEVTRSVEQSMATVSNIKQVQSISQENASMVILEFEQTADMDSVSLEMREKLDQIKGTWDETVANPTIVKMNPSMLPVVITAVSASGNDAAKTSQMIEEKVIPELESVEGVASVTASGSIEQSVEVTVNEKKIQEYNAQMQDTLNKQFDEAQKALDEARAKVEEGKAALQEGQKQAAEQMGSAESEISKKNAELTQAQLEIKEKKSELNLAKTQLAKATTQLSVQEKALNAQKDNLETLYAKKDKIQSAYDQVNEKIKKLQEAGQEVPQELLKQQAELKTQLEILSHYDSAMKTITDGLTKLEQQKQELNKQNEQIATGEKVLKQTEEQMNKGAITLAQARGKLASAQIETAAALAAGNAQIAAGETALTSQETQADAAKKQVEESADITEILTADMVKSFLAAQNFSMPAGYVQENGIDYLIRVGDKIQSIEELENLTLLKVEGMNPVKLSDVADVNLVTNSDEVYARINGEPGVLLSINKQTGYSTKEVSDRILEKMQQIEKEQKSIHSSTLMDQGIYIDMIVDSVFQNLICGAVLAIIVLLVFLKNFRPTLVIACSIPISILTAIVLMYFTGITLNVISLSGLALGVGMLVDNSIVVIENIYRMRNEEHRSAKEAAIEGAKQVSGAITASTLTTVCVFLPIVFTEGITRQLFVDMGLTIAYALIASLVIALTLVPMISAGLLKRTEEKESGFYIKLKEAYGKLLEKSHRRKGFVLIGAFVLLIASTMAAFSRGTEFMPPMESTQMSMTLETEEGTPMEETAKVADQVAKEIMKIEDVQDVGAMMASGNMMGNGTDQKTTEVQYYILTKEDKKLSDIEIKNKILKRTKGLPCTLDIQTSTMDMSAVGSAGISVEIKGRDLDTLQKTAKEVADIVKSVEGTKNVLDGTEESTKEMRISIQKDKAAEYNLTVAQVYQQLSSKLAEAQSATQLLTTENTYEVYVKDAQNETLTRNDIKAMKLTAKKQDGTEQEVPLSDIADFEEATGLQAVSRKDQSRYMNVTAELEDGYNIGLVSQKIKDKLDDYQAPSGYEIKMAGEDQTIQEAMTEVTKMLLLAIVFMYLIMVAQFQSLRSPFIIMFTIPLAFTGGFLGLFLAGKAVSVIAMIGFVMLSGIIVNNGIVFVDYTNQLVNAGYSQKEALIETGKTRLRPIIMTALTTVLGLSTMAAGLGMGADMTQPMAIVTVGGLIYGTILTLFVVPCIYNLFHKKERARLKDEIEEK